MTSEPESLLICTALLQFVTKFFQLLFYFGVNVFGLSVGPFSFIGVCHVLNSRLIVETATATATAAPGIAEENGGKTIHIFSKIRTHTHVHTRTHAHTHTHRNTKTNAHAHVDTHGGTSAYITHTDARAHHAQKHRKREKHIYTKKRSIEVPEQRRY